MTLGRYRRSQACVLPFAALALSMFGVSPAVAQDANALAKAAQNPIASMISVPIQYNANPHTGPEHETQHVLNIQPVYPLSLSPDWNLITRTILPLVSQPPLGGPSTEREAGLGDIQFSAFLSPVKAGPGGWIWGAGPILVLRTASDAALGQGKWSAGPTAVALKVEGPWVFGALINNVWSFAGDDDRPSVNQMLLQPFVNYNVPGRPGFYLTSSPIVTADWKASRGQRWTVPIGIGAGQITRWGHQPVNLQVAAYYNIEHPDQAPRWNLRAQVQFLFPR